MSDHQIVWDHRDCEHGDERDDDFWCRPEGTITCLADGPGVSMCRYSCNDDTKLPYVCEDGWTLCDDPALHTVGPDFDHVDPGVLHCTRGHLLVVGECNALLFIEGAGDVCDSYEHHAGPDEYRDGAVDVEWTGDSYLWSYAKPTEVESLPLFDPDRPTKEDQQ